jgi:large subunit ribosomal protein L29
MKAKEYRELSPEELQDKLNEQKKHLYDLRSQSVTEKLDNSRSIKNARRYIARIMTVVRQQKK